MTLDIDAGHAAGRRIVGTRLFFISYVPLWAIFAARSESTTVFMVFALLTGAGLVDAVRIIDGGLRRSTRRIVLTEVSDKSGDVAGYLATYLLPFIAGPPDDLRGALAVAIYFVTAWAVFVPSSLGLVNPTLYLLGWRIVEATVNGAVALVVCQDIPLASPDGVPASQLMGRVGWVCKPTRRPWCGTQKARGGV